VQKESVPLHTTYNQAAIERAPKISSFFQALLPVALRFRQKGHFDPRAEMMVDVWSEKLLTRDIKETSQKVWPSPLPPPPHKSFFPFFSRTIEQWQTPKRTMDLVQQPIHLQ
jgi:hypothetical protein